MAGRCKLVYFCLARFTLILIVFFFIDNAAGQTPCPGIPTVTYETKTYNTVQIGTQCWLKENLDVGSMIPGIQDQTDNSTIEKYCYNNEADSCTAYGGLYQWDELMDYASSSSTTPSCVQGICPPGWHLPSMAEWDTLIDYMGGGSIAGGELKETDTAHWQSPNTGATNTSGFTALPGGIRNSGGGFQGLGPHAYFYTATHDNPLNAWSQRLFYDATTISPNTGTKSMGASVRCILDYCPVATEADAGPDQTGYNSTCTILEGNVPGAEENGMWTIASGTGGSFEDPGDSQTRFNGTSGTTYELVWTISNCCGNSDSDTMTMEMLPVPGTPCPGTPTVNYGGKIYNTIVVGSQCWLKENLNVGTYIAGNLDQTDNDTIEKYCYNNDTTYCDSYGGMYQWSEMMAYTASSSTVPSGIRGICPSGWHIPSRTELDSLIDFLGGELLAGGPLKEMGYCHWEAPNAGATNAQGYTALPTGRRVTGGTFDLFTESAFLYTATEDNEFNAWSRRLFDYNTVISEHIPDKAEGLAVRCLRDYCGEIDTLGVTISPSSNPSCEGDTVCLTPLIINGGTNPSIQWYVNDTLSGNDTTLCYPPADNDSIFCVVTSNDTCASNNPDTSNLIIMTVNPVQPVSVTIVASDDSVCAGDSVTFTATPVNGGSNPAYQWKVNGADQGTNSPLFTYEPLDGDVVTCVLTSDISCPSGNPATSNQITITVYPPPITDGIWHN